MPSKCSTNSPKQGLNVQLTAVGGDVPKEFRRPFVTSVGRLNRAVPEQAQELDRLLSEADFCIHPARAECFGHSLCEALAFGVPVLATDTGGISQCVSHGETGLLLPPTARPHEFAQEALGLVGDPDGWLSMRARAISDFRGRLNWDRWAIRLLAITTNVLSPMDEVSAPRNSAK